MRRLAIVATVCTFAGRVHAESAVELQAKGEDLAKAGRYVDAIEAFKAADRLDVRASHACLIALAYTRRELWPQAEIWLETCQKRVAPGDAYPDWGRELETQIGDRLAAANVAAVEIVVEPAGVAVQLTASSFLPDETFEPRTIHLPPGHHVIFAKAAGYRDAEQEVTVADKAPRHVVIALRPVATPPPHVPARRGGALLIAGAIAAGVGIAGFAWMTVEHGRLDDASRANDLTRYQRSETAYDVSRVGTIAALAVAAGLVVTGAILHRDRDAPVLSAAPSEHGGVVSLTWQR